MPTARQFDQIPPFPSGTPLVPLPKVSLQELQGKSKAETRRMFEACCEWGFLLDLKNSYEGEILLQDAEKMFLLTTETFALDQSILDSYDYKPPHDITGYKQKGKLKTDDGKTDCMELYTIRQDDIHGNCPRRNNAGPIEVKRADIGEFLRHAHSVVDVILARLDEQLGLEAGTPWWSGRADCFAARYITS
ncbi:hypothetical protein MGU_06723 [Metarhizium guizhouense ARSEF 977]|uniref:Non-haem dioxygenase N-terminal domain-containing protein n=1 Tax=Metarhizium guizhouense (strain ARSEF 977) TaxID=1276136 RepID=A0A0B4H8F9_METGA|nr:hypothetical protein MGU_06723 [Metarhizium guizhouense ARSEF 977]